jgi:hypothetical protein
VNPGLAIGRWIEESNLGIVLPRFDPASVASAIVSLKERRAALPEQAVHMRRIFLTGHVWPVMEQKLGELYRKLGEHSINSGAASLLPERSRSTL